MTPRNSSSRRGAFGAAYCLSVFIAAAAFSQNPIHVTYLWHMHQPIYFPYESVSQTDSNNRFIYSVRGIHDERFGNYGEWPKNAVQQGHDRNMPHAGVQVSFSGSLMENLRGVWGDGWRDHWRWGRNSLRTVRNNPRLDLIGFAYHHSLMPLTSRESMIMQIRLHREAYIDNWNTGGSYSKGFFPPESSFATHMIPALVDQGIEWVLVDNGHFDRTLSDFPWSAASSIKPNRAEQRNGSAANKNSTWTQLNNVWAPTRVAAPWSYQPHYVRHVDPSTGQVRKMIVVPAGRYEGNENGRGGYGAFKPENVWGTHIDKNNNPSKPMIIVAHSDGDNFGMKNADAFHGQHGLFLNMIQANPNFSHTTVQDYLDMYPPDANDLIHVEPGSWVGIDGGTPYYDKWVEKNARDAQHPDYWSWSVIVAAQNRVLHADNLENQYSINDVRWGIGNDTAKAWRYFLQAETSCHWYWDYDTANPWDGNATRGSNLAIAEANKVINRHSGIDRVGPSIFPPQRPIWNPGGTQWNNTDVQPSDFGIWTFVDDVSGVSDVRLYWRTADWDTWTDLNQTVHEVYTHTPGKNSAWNIVPMTGTWYPTAKGPNVPDPAARAMKYDAMITGQNNTLINYFVEAVDTKGNTSRSEIFHVWVGAAHDGGGGGGGGGGSVSISPAPPVAGQSVTVTYSGSLASGAAVNIHHGFNGGNWTSLPGVPMTKDGNVWKYTYTVPATATTIGMVFNDGSSWDNNGGQNWNFAVTNQPPTDPPAAPSRLTATAASHTRVNLAWTAAAGATSYKILRGGTQIGTSASASYADTTVQPSTSYTYTVVAANSAGDSGASNEASATTPARPVEPPPFVVGGENRPGYLLTSPGMKIHAAVRGTKLYVATWFAGTANGNDHFIFVTDQLLPAASATVAADWNKIGQIAMAANKPYLAQESVNGWTGWSNAPAGSTANASSSGNIVEGVIDLVDAFGAMPDVIYLAAAAYGTDDGGVLAGQAPAALTVNGNIEPDEFLAIPVESITDSKGDNRLDRLDRQRGFRVDRFELRGDQPVLQAATVPGMRYKVQHKASLADSWVDLPGTYTGSGEDAQAFMLSDRGLAPSGFYRLVVEP